MSCLYIFRLRPMGRSQTLLCLTSLCLYSCLLLFMLNAYAYDDAFNLLSNLLIRGGGEGHNKVYTGLASMEYSFVIRWK